MGVDAAGAPGRDFLRRHVPAWLKALVRRRRAAKRRRQLLRSPTVGAARLVEDLRSLGLDEGDVVMVHASLRALGHVDGGAETVIRSLQDVVGPDGTLVLPTFSIVSSMDETLKDETRVFDPATTPSTVGKITDVFRQAEGVVRSVHPTHSVAAWGRHAELVTKDHHLAPSNFGEGTPFGRLLELDGKVCGLGIGFGPVTFYHVPEDLTPERHPRVYLPEPRTARVLVDGVVEQLDVRCHDPELHARRIDKTPEIESWFRDYFLAHSIARTGPVGAGEAWWMRARRLVDALDELSRKGVTIYDVGRQAGESAGAAS